MKREEAVERILKLAHNVTTVDEILVNEIVGTIAKAGGRVQFPCEECKGSGMIKTNFPRQRCNTCSGSGWVTVEG